MTKYEDILIKILKSSEKEAMELNHQFVGSEHLLLSILKTDNYIKNILNNNSINYDNVKDEIKHLKKFNENNKMLLYTPLLKRILIMSSKNNIISLKSVFIKLLENGEGIALSILNNLNADIKSIYKQVINNKKTTYGINLNDEQKIHHENIIGRDNEIEEIIEILCRKNKNNPILVGKAGVGKTAIIEELAYRIENKEVPECLYNKKIISINLSELISGTRYRGEFEEKINNLIKEFESNKDLILFIDEIHTLIGAGGAEGAIDASNILKPYLSRNKIKCIGATTIEEYNNTILKDKALNRRFYKIDIKEPNQKETITILLNAKKHYEKYHNISISANQIKLIVELSNKYIKDKYEPDKSLDILDKICTKAKLSEYKSKSIVDKINKLLKEKERYIKNKDFNQANLINKKIDKIKNNNKLIVNNLFIKNCFNITNNNSIGFKYI